jgi:hypothetical protein
MAPNDPHGSATAPAVRVGGHETSSARQRKIKVYRAVRSGADRTLTDELGEHRQGHRQVSVLVAARSRNEARVLFGINTGDMAHSGGETGNATDIATATAEPGQVFARWHGLTAERPWHRARPSGYALLPGTSTLALAEELLAAEKAGKAQRRADEEARAVARTERAARNEETNRRAGEALDRLQPILAEYGVRPDTINVTARGVWMPPEVAETVAALLGELQELRAL